MIERTRMRCLAALIPALAGLGAEMPGTGTGGRGTDGRRSGRTRML